MEEENVHGSSRSLLLKEDVTTLLVESGVDSSESGLGALNFDHVDGLLKSRFGQESGGVNDSTTSWDDLRNWD